MAESLKVVHGDLNKLPQAVREFVIEKALWCTPDDIWLCDGSHVENATLLKRLMDDGMIKALPKYDNCWLAHTDPADVARVEKFTFICTPEKQQTTPLTKPGVEGKLANWMSPERLEKELAERFPGCMKGRTMYVIPFSMGPIGSPVSKIGIELTDSAYVVVSMRIMTRIGAHVLEVLGDGKFVRSTHSVGRPLPLDAPVKCHWPCNPEKVLVVHVPSNYEIFSYGSGYGGNSLLGKKCFALRLGSTLAREEGWLAEHMLILGLTNPQGETKYVVAAFPSCSGKTNLAMITPSLPGWTATCVGDDIAWMWFDDDGLLRAVNPENGFFGVAPGTSDLTNHVAMATIFKDTIFTNVAETSDGGVWWEGMEEPEPGVTVTSWLGETNWTKAKGTQAAHPNSRFCTPARNCPIIDANWENPKGVPISAILFGGRRPKGVPLVHEALTWQHGVFLGAAMRSEATAAAEFKGKVIMHDPFAMRPFFGYNFGEYCKHWISFEYKDGLKLPKIFYVNWFRTDENNKFLWPGFGDNVRVMEWIFRRCDGEDCAVSSAIGYLPHEDSLHLEGLAKKPDMHRLFDVRKAFWEEEIAEIEAYFAEQVGDDTPKEIIEEIENLKKRIAEIH